MQKNTSVTLGATKSKNIDKQFLEVLEMYFNQNIYQTIDAGCEFSYQEIEKLIKNSSKELNKNIALIFFLFFGSLILVGIFFSKFRQFKSEVQQVLMAEDKILRKVFDSQEIFWVCD